MMNLLKSLFTGAPAPNYRELITQGAIIVDVRSRGEYASGHIKGSVNIPLDQLSNNLGRFKSKEAPIITCCASGMRSSSAKSQLQSNGFTNVHNGGGWHALSTKLN